MLIKINLTPEQIDKLRPLGEELYHHFHETGERQMFAGQVITSENGEFHQVAFGLIPSGQSSEIERIRGLGAKAAGHLLDGVAHRG